MEKKIKFIARECEPEYANVCDFDEEYFTNDDGDNYAIYIPKSTCAGGFHDDEYEEIVSKIETIRYKLQATVEEFENIGKNELFETEEELFAHYDIPEDGREAMRNFLNNADTNSHFDADDVATFLTITTGAKWNVKSFTGRNELDRREILYCPDNYEDEQIDEIGKFWLGCGTEFGIGEWTEDCKSVDDVRFWWGYCVTDDVMRDTNELTKKLAEFVWCKPEEIEVHLFEGYDATDTAKYRKL